MDSGCHVTPTGRVTPVVRAGRGPWEFPMPVSYTCPNPGCGVTLKTANRVPPGKRVKCPKCQEMFTPEPEEEPAPPPADAGVLKFADDEPPKKPAGKKPPGVKPAPPKPAPLPFPPETPPEDDGEESDESIKKGYGVVKETAAELEQAEKVKVKFGEVQDKYKKSARGPAIALLVMPSNLLTAAGLLLAVAGVAGFVIGMWPLVFNDVPPGPEEEEEAIVTMLLALVTFGWGCFTCFGASQMQSLSSYLWGMAGAVMGVPLLVGIYALVVLQDPKVKAGFEEVEGGEEDEDEDDTKKKDEDDEDDDEDDDDEDDEDEPKPKKPKKGPKARRRDEDDDD